MDPEAEAAIAALPEKTQNRLNLLRLRLLMAPDAKKYLGKEPDPLSEAEEEALAEMGRELERRVRLKP